MPEQLRALIVILILSSFVFYSFKRFAYKLEYGSEYQALTKLWYVTTIAAFLSGNYWLFLAIISILVGTHQSKRSDVWLVFVFLGLMMPAIPKLIPGFFGINNFGELNWYRFLALIVLLPRFLVILGQGSLKPFRSGLDKLVFAFFLLVLLLDFSRSESITVAARFVAYHTLEVLVPYYVISRDISSLDDIKKAFFGMALVIAIAAFIAVFEAAKSWQLYNQLTYIFDGIKNENIMDYKYRGGILRARAMYGTIPLGLISFIGFFLAYFSLQHYRSHQAKFIYALTVLGGVAALSRGPWVAFAMAVSAHFFLYRRVMKLILFGVVGTVLILLSPAGDKFISMLPFVGSVETNTISYRYELFTTSWKVILQNPFFGSDNYLSHHLMQSLVQGEGIVDIVNTYLQLALRYGLVTTSVFILIGGYCCICLLKWVKRKDTYSVVKDISITLLVILLMTYATIATVSSLSGPVYFLLWIFIAICSGMFRLSAEKLSQQSLRNE